MTGRRRVAPSKRAELETQGWTFTAVPRFIAEGLIRNSQTGWRSPAHYDYEQPEAWVVTPPPGLPISERRFENSSPIPAVRWAWDQAMAPQPSPEMGGVAALTMLAAAARSSGVVFDGDDKAPSPLPLPDIELLNLCREVAGCDRIAEVWRNDDSSPWDQPVAHRAAMDRMSEACRARDKLVPRVLELDATTPAGVLAKARVVLMLFATGRGRRAEAVRTLVANIIAVLEPDAGRRTGA